MQASYPDRSDALAVAAVRRHSIVQGTSWQLVAPRLGPAGDRILEYYGQSTAWVPPTLRPSLQSNESNSRGSIGGCGFGVSFGGRADIAVTVQGLRVLECSLTEGGR
jgi:hypothetical protein